jgi:hypothetical protein
MSRIIIILFYFFSFM